MPPTVDLLDPASDGDVAAAADLMTAVWREVLGPDEPAYPSAQMVHDLRLERDDIDVTAFFVRDSERPIGLAVLDVRAGHGNEHMAWLADLFVLPAERRRGAGSRLFDAVVDVSRAAGRTLVIGAHEEGHEAGRAFAAWAGATPGVANRQSRLRLADIDRDLMKRWIAAADERTVGYSLVSFDDVCPDDLLEPFVKAISVMNTAPRPDSLEESVFTAEQRRVTEAERARAGDQQWVVCARHDATGDLAGFTELTFSPHRPWLVEQGDTAVDPAHRQRGIGRWLKATNVLRVLDERPEARVVETWNDGTNAGMLSINVTMGFRPASVWRDAELTLG